MTGEAMTAADLAERCARLEGRTRTLGATAVAALLAAAASLALTLTVSSRSNVPGPNPRFRVVESERFVLVDGAGKVRARLEAAPDGDARFTLGDDLGSTAAPGSALGLGVGPGIAPQLTLRRGDGSARATLAAGQGLSLWSGERPPAGIVVRTDGASSLLLVDSRGAPHHLEAAPPLAPGR